MLQNHRSLVTLLLSLLTPVLATACSPDKGAQCNKFAQVNEKVRVSLTKHENSGKALTQKQPTNLVGLKALAKEYSNFFNTSAQDIETALKIIEGLEVQDKQLQTFKSSYINITKKAGEGTRDLSKIAAAQSELTEADLKAGKLQQLGHNFDAVSQQIAASGNEEKELIKQFNNYCTGK